MQNEKPLSGIKIIEIASGIASSHAGRLLCLMGAETIMVEPPQHSPLRRMAPFLSDGVTSSPFSYFAAGKKSVICDLTSKEGQTDLYSLLQDADILIVDAPIGERNSLGLDQVEICDKFPNLVYLSILPFGATGPKAHWKGSELNLIHSGGEGFLLPNGLSADLFPERPPLKIAGYFAEMQGGAAGALAALSALWSKGGEFVDISIQDANVAVGAFAIQRLGDGSIEHRLTRSFRYGGVIQCSDGFVELLTLEERQWEGLVQLMGSPDWAKNPEFTDVVGRSAKGDEINEHIRSWARDWKVEDLVSEAQKLGVPMARYSEPSHILNGEQEIYRGIFHEVETNNNDTIKVQTLPFRFGVDPLSVETTPLPGANQAEYLSSQTLNRVTA